MLGRENLEALGSSIVSMVVSVFCLGEELCVSIALSHGLPGVRPVVLGLMG